MSHESACYADHAVAMKCRVVENVCLAERTYRLRIVAPAIARACNPGQFVMVRLVGTSQPLLARPFAMYDVVTEDGEATYLDIVYLVLGKMTARLATIKPSDVVEVWGPLGNGFPQLDVEHLIMVAGGIGQTPFLAVGSEFLGKREYARTATTSSSPRRATLCYGVRTAALAAGVEDFRSAGMNVLLSSDDGTLGQAGFVTTLLAQLLEETTGQSRAVLCCGPEKMMHAVADICAAADVDCYVSLETPMACGLGICFSCVAPVREDDGNWDYRRTCVEGPVFAAESIAWEAM